MAKPKVVNDSESGPKGQFLYGRSPFYGFADDPEGQPMDPDDTVNAMSDRAASQARTAAGAAGGYVKNSGVSSSLNSLVGLAGMRKKK